MAAKVSSISARSRELVLRVDRRTDWVVIDPSRFVEIAQAMIAASYFEATEAFGAALKAGDPEPLNGRVWTAKDGVSPLGFTG